MAKKVAKKMATNKKPSKTRTGSHSAGGKKRYTDVKRRTTRTASGYIGRNMRTHSGRAYMAWETEEARDQRKAAAKRNKRLSNPTGRVHSGSAEKSSADVSNRRRTASGQGWYTNAGRTPARDPNSSINRKKRAAAEKKAAAKADVSQSNPPGFQ